MKISPARWASVPNMATHVPPGEAGLNRSQLPHRLCVVGVLRVQIGKEFK